MDKLFGSETPGSIVSWIVLRVDLFPLTGGRVVSDLLHTIGNKHVEAAGIAAAVSQNDLAIRPEYFSDFIIFKLMLEHLADLTETRAAVHSNLGIVIGFSGVTRALPITNDQRTWSFSSMRRRYEH